MCTFPYRAGPSRRVTTGHDGPDGSRRARRVTTGQRRATGHIGSVDGSVDGSARDQPTNQPMGQPGQPRRSALDDDMLSCMRGLVGPGHNLVLLCRCWHSLCRCRQCPTVPTAGQCCDQGKGQMPVRPNYMCEAVLIVTGPILQPCSPPVVHIPWSMGGLWHTKRKPSTSRWLPN